MSNNVILVTGSYDQSLLFWDAQTGQHIYQYRYPENQLINRLEISADKKHLGAACSSSIRIYDMQGHTPYHNTVYSGFTNNVTGVGFSKDQQWVYGSSEDGSIRIFDLRAKGFKRQYKNDCAVNCIQLHPNEGDLIIGDQNGFIKIYDLVADRCRQKIETQKDVGIRSLSIALNAYCMVAADSAGQCHVYRLKNSEELELMQKMEAHNDYILKCLISPDVSLMATCSADKTVKIWNLISNKGYVLNKTLYGHNKWVWDCAFSWGKVEYIVTGSTDSFAKIWQIDSGETLRVLKEHTKGINCLAMNDVPL